MTEIQEQLYTRMTNYSGLYALVGDRIYPNVRAQDATLPCLSYLRVSDIDRFSCMGSDPGLVKALYQVDVWASTYDEANAVAKQVRLAFQRWRNSSGVNVQDTFIRTIRDLSEEDRKEYHIAIEIELNYNE